MTVVEAALAPYKAFTIEEGRPPAFVVRTHDEASVFPYAHLLGVCWVDSDRQGQILIEHRFFNLYLHGRNLEPLLMAFGRFAVDTIHVFDTERNATVDAGETIITHIDDHYEKDGGKPVRPTQKR